jgi:hypothetical protein
VQLSTEDGSGTRPLDPSTPDPAVKVSDFRKCVLLLYINMFTTRRLELCQYRCSRPPRVPLLVRRHEAHPRPRCLGRSQSRRRRCHRYCPYALHHRRSQRNRGSYLTLTPSPTLLLTNPPPVHHRLYQHHLRRPPRQPRPHRALRTNPRRDRQ